MTLHYPGHWKFDGIGVEISNKALSSFTELVLKTAAGPRRREILDEFKSAFGRSGWSSSEDWAETDLCSAMSDASDNAALFIDCLWNGIEAVDSWGVPVPSAKNVNDILNEHDIPLIVDPPGLSMKEGDVTVVESATETEGDTQLPVYARREVLGRGGYPRPGVLIGK